MAAGRSGVTERRSVSYLAKAVASRLSKTVEFCVVLRDTTLYINRILFINKGKTMENSASYVAIETMIEGGWLWMQFEELEKLLDLLEKKGLISSTEHQELLALARRMKIDNLSRQ
jgi:hypothetical protein